jgi:hypothetical protein
MTLTDHLMDRRSGVERRRSPRDAAAPAVVDPILAWNLDVPEALKRIRCQDPWAQVVQQSLVDEHDGAHEDAGRAWDPRAIWEVTGRDPTGLAPATGAEAIRSLHRELGRRTNWTIGQEIHTVEASRGPIVQAHARTTARRGDRILDIPTLLVFELSCLRIQRVTESPGDLRDWVAFWSD